MKAIASEEVGERIAQWYSCIITRDFEEAEKLKEEVDLKITNMTEDDKIVSYYQLVDFRYQMLLQVHEGKNLTEPPGTNLENLGDSYLRFMFYFVTGVYEFWQGRYKSAIRSFKVAEMLIEKVNDPLEKAEFYHRLGLSYYRINQYTFSMSYLEQALEYFEKQKIYTENVIMIKSIIAAIYTEVEQYSKAELIYDELIELSKLYPTLFALLRRNFGLHRLAQNRLSEAEVLFSEAIDIPAF
ncbi:hypothetical protein ABC345_02915 [Shouchella sp. 1P09AA]|uniref:response regulator aspartate phosphatase n=1 Tax=unclassified Shouchella TaxID=2893065 RepID=UPI0039A0E003